MSCALQVQKGHRSTRPTPKQRKKKKRKEVQMSANEYYNGAAPPPPGVAAAPSDQNTPAPNKSIFHHQASQHQSHHYLRMYGGQVAQAAMWGFGATLGADVANAAFGEAKVGGWVGTCGQADRKE